MYVYTGNSPWSWAARPVVAMKSPGKDLAVIKLDRDVGKQYSYSDDILASEPSAEVKRPSTFGDIQNRDELKGSIVGFGANDTQRVINWSNWGRTELRNVGHGTKRVGNVQARKDYGSDMLALWSDPSMNAPGDSGGPLFMKDARGKERLYGVCKSARAEGHQAIAAHDGHYTPTFDNRKWILNTLSDLVCK